MFGECLRTEMSASEEKFRWENTARLLYFKYRGNLTQVTDELRKIYENPNISFEFVVKVIKKFKEQQKREYGVNVAANFLEYAFAGTKQREIGCTEDLDKLSKHEFILRSGCCNAVAERKVRESDQVEYFVCLKCAGHCSTYKVPDLEVFAFRQGLREEIRKDEQQLVKSVTDLGFAGEEKVPQILEKHTHYELNTGQGLPPDSLPEADRKILQDVRQVDSRTRESAIKEIEKLKNRMLTEGKVEENEPSE